MSATGGGALSLSSPPHSPVALPGMRAFDDGGRKSRVLISGGDVVLRRSPATIAAAVQHEGNLKGVVSVLDTGSSSSSPPRAPSPGTALSSPAVAEPSSPRAAEEEADTGIKAPLLLSAVGAGDADASGAGAADADEDEDDDKKPGVKYDYWGRPMA